ncbi:glyoxalase [Bacillus salacetis]|uniref:Glyoxalase n=1 Tax=Bacillus salacetis TaxID=2315464 RepID=A0A3A1QVC4_9BACI|nr:VOC family protein [Bacillus salacetis]RIW32023.1 glyoxalase [Bacillus salacetis]
MSRFLMKSHCIFPTESPEQTTMFYKEKMGFEIVSYMDAAEPHICLYRDHTEIILTRTNGQTAIPNRHLYGYGYDGYFITENQDQLQEEFIQAGVTIIRKLKRTDYNNREFVAEDIDGRWIAFGIKSKSG